ncbi:MAG: helix-turn-helix domain-containing protein [Candidatus Sulfotelmatobacter sp.]
MMTPQTQKKLIEILENSKFFETIKREFDRSFEMLIDEKDGKIRIQVQEQDTGSTVMTVGDVAAFLQIDRASVRRMTRERSQRQSRHPMPFVKIGAKMIRFNRPDIEAWWRKCCENGNGALALPPKGKIKKTK